MSDAEGPEWLRLLQEQFSTVIRTPLDRSTGTLRAQTEAYPAECVAIAIDGPRTSAAQRLAVYNRQYWFRLFTVLQTAFVVTARLMGYWRFNEFAARFLDRTPPRGWDIDRVADGFERFIAVECAGLDEGPMWAEAATLDATWRALMREKVSTPFQLASEFPEAAARLAEARLVRSPSVALLCERWPLLEWRAVLFSQSDRDGARLAPPSALATVRWWALVRERDGVRQIPLEPREGALLALLAELPVGEALAQLEASCADEERAELPAKAQRWLASSVVRGVWCAATIDGR